MTDKPINWKVDEELYYGLIELVSTVSTDQS